MRAALLWALLALSVSQYTLAQDGLELLRDLDPSEADSLAMDEVLRDGPAQTTAPATQKPLPAPAQTTPPAQSATANTTTPKAPAGQQQQQQQQQQGTVKATQSTSGNNSTANVTASSANSTVNSTTEFPNNKPSLANDTHKVRPGGCQEATDAYKAWLAEVHENCKAHLDQNACRMTWESSSQRKVLRHDIDVQCSHHNASNSSISDDERSAEAKTQQEQRRNLQEDAAEVALQARRFAKQADSHNSLAAQHAKRAAKHGKSAKAQNQQSIAKEVQRTTAAKRAVYLKAQAKKHRAMAASALAQKKHYRKLRKDAEKQVRYWSQQRAKALEAMGAQQAKAVEAGKKAKAKIAQQVWNEGLAMRARKKALEASEQATTLSHKAQREEEEALQLQQRSEKALSKGTVAEQQQEALNHNLTLAEAAYKQHHAKAVHTWMEYQEALKAARGLKRIAHEDLLRTHKDLDTVKGLKGRIRRLRRKAEKLRTISEAHKRAAAAVLSNVHHARTTAAALKQIVPKEETRAKEASKRADSYTVEHSHLLTEAMAYKDKATHEQTHAEEAATNEARARHLERRYFDLVKHYHTQWKAEQRTAAKLMSQARKEKTSAEIAAQQRDAALKLRDLSLQRQQERKDFAEQNMEAANDALKQSAQLEKHRHRLLEQLQALGDVDGDQGSAADNSTSTENTQESQAEGSKTQSQPSQSSGSKGQTVETQATANKSDKSTKSQPSKAMQKLRCDALKQACKSGDAKACARWNSSECLDV